MNEYDVRRFGLICAKNAEVEAMKAENKRRELLRESLAYSEKAFMNVSEEISNLSYCHNEQL